MTKILFATNNQHKLKEVKEILPEIDWLFLGDFPQLSKLDPEETGSTFEENAKIKAIEFGEASRVLSMADDSGLEVFALGGQPGVRSARWVPGTNEDRYFFLLQELAGEKNRSAQFVSALCLYDPDKKKEYFFRGEAKGAIAKKSQGSGGFGYDSVFIPAGERLTFAQLAEAGNKHKYSHRRKSLNAFHEWWLRQDDY
jgi:XTP/dITP diphosphohydrolase